jgi:hypothetical protein
MRLSLAFAAVLSLPACGSPNAGQSTGRPVASTSKSETGDVRTAKSGDGLAEATGTQGGSEARLPDFVPAYPGAEVQTSVDMDAGGVKMHIVTMVSPDKPDKILAFYKEKWKAASNPTKRIADSVLGIDEPEPSGITESRITLTPTAAGTSIYVLTATQ